MHTLGKSSDKSRLPVFIHAALDERGLSASEFRVFCHVARRAGNGVCFASVPNMAAVCQLHPQTIRDALKNLTNLSMIGVTHRPGQSSEYKIIPESEWQPYRKEYPTEKDTGVSVSVGTPTKPMEGDPTEKDVDEVNPSEVTPFKLLHEEAASVSKPSKAQSDDEWILGLENDPAYQGIEVKREHAKMIRWCSTNRKQPTRRRFVNWLNRADRKLTSNSTKPNHAEGF
jgi:hypothetical protein